MASTSSQMNLAEPQSKLSSSNNRTSSAFIKGNTYRAGAAAGDRASETSPQKRQLLAKQEPPQPKKDEGDS